MLKQSAMQNIPRTHEDIEAHIHKIQSQKKIIPQEGSLQLVRLGDVGYFDSDTYEQTGKVGKNKYEGYVTSIAATDEIDDEDDNEECDGRHTGFGAPVALFNDIVKSDNDYEPFADRRRPRLIDKEDEYRRKRRRIAISPERVDPFAEDGQTGANSRGYTEIMKEQMLKREEFELRKKILEKSKERSLMASKKTRTASKNRSYHERGVEKRWRKHCK